MQCKKCGRELPESYTDFSVSYIGYVERYVDCHTCKTTNIFRYEFTEIVSFYPMTRYEDKSEKEKCYEGNENLKTT